MGAQISKEESDIGSIGSSSGVNSNSSNSSNNNNIKKERRYTTNSGNLHFLYQQEEGIGINYKTGGFNNSVNSSGNNLKESSSLDDLESIATTSLSISSSTPPPLEINYSSSNNNSNSNNNKSNKSVHFTRTRSRSLNISKASYKSNDPATPLNNSFNSNSSSTSILEQTTTTNTTPKLSSNSLTSSSSTSSLSSSTKGEKIQGRKSKSSNALFKSLKASFNSSSSSSSNSSNNNNNKERDRSASISSSKSSSTNSLIIEKQTTTKSTKHKKSPNTSTESLSLSSTNTSSSSLSSSATPPLHQKSNSFSKSQNTSTDSLGSSSNSTSNKNSGKSSNRHSRSNSKEVSLDSSKLSSKPIDNNSTDNNNNNNNNNQTILIDKLTDQLHKDPFFKNTNNNSESLQAQQPQPLPSSSLPPKKQPPPLPPKNFKPTTNMISNPPSPQQPQLYVNNNNNNKNNSNSNNLTKLSNGYYSLKKSSSISNSSFPPIEPTYPSASENSSKRSSVEIKYLEENHKYIITDRLGSGAFSDVYCCVSKETKKQYAIKIIDKSLVAMIAAHTDMKITTEVDILKSSFHPHIISIFDHFETETYYYIVTELLQGGELLYQLEKNHPSTNNTVSNYTEEHARKIIKQVVQAVSFLHSNNIVHRDLKPENILFRDRSMGSILKIIDFGLATYIENNGDGSNTLVDVCGTPEFQPPEMLKREGYSFSVDIWSTGIILYILLCGHPPFFGKNNMVIMSLIIKGQLSFDAENGWDNVSELAKDLIRKMLNPDPSQRLTANQVLEHEWITTAIDENGSPQLGAPFGRQLRRYNSHRNFKQIGDTLLRSQRYLYLNNETNGLKRRSIQL